MDLESGDLLLFDGFTKLSKAVKFFSGGAFSHVAVIWRCPSTKNLYVWENGDPNEREYPIISKKGAPHSSAHLTPLDVKLKGYKGDIFVRRLIKRKELSNFPDKLNNFVIENIGKPYRPDFVASWNQGKGVSLIHLPFLEDHGENVDSWICSELVLKTYETCGVINLRALSHSVVPEDFSDIEVSERITINDGFAFMELEHVKSNKI